MSSDVDLRPPGLKIASPFTVVLWTVRTKFKPSTTIGFRVTSAHGTDGQTDRRTDVVQCVFRSAIERVS